MVIDYRCEDHSKNEESIVGAHSKYIVIVTTSYTILKLHPPSYFCQNLFPHILFLCIYEIPSSSINKAGIFETIFIAALQVITSQSKQSFP